MSAIAVAATTGVRSEGWGIAGAVACGLPVPTAEDLPRSLAIAGIHGYIGQLIYEAALDVGVPRILGFDPGPPPPGFRRSARLEMIPREDDFYELDADLFHLATHPERREGAYRLLERGRRVTIEKPMAHPADPAEADRLRAAARASAGSVLFDFVEVFNPRIVRMRAALARLRRHADFRLTRIHCERSKDREDATNPRNHKRMVPIQYQETAHCLAALLFALDLPPSFAAAFPNGLAVEALAAPYDPPNPEDYPLGVVDGKVVGEFRFDGITIAVRTDFKRRGAGPFKRFAVEGFAGGRGFRLEAIYDGAGERLHLDGAAAPDGGSARHQDIVRQSWRWHRHPPAAGRPDADFAWLVFGMSAALWASCHQGRELRIGSEAELRATMRAYPDSLAKRARYPALGWHEELDHRGVVEPAPAGGDRLL